MIIIMTFFFTCMFIEKKILNFYVYHKEEKLNGNSELINKNLVKLMPWICDGNWKRGLDVKGLNFSKRFKIKIRRKNEFLRNSTKKNFEMLYEKNNIKIF